MINLIYIIILAFFIFLVYISGKKQPDKSVVCLRRSAPVSRYPEGIILL